VTPDSIEREIQINAPIDRVWSLVSKSGWWIGDELVWTFPAVVGEIVTISHEKYGNFDVLTEKLDPPRYAAYRWAAGFQDQKPTDLNTTLIEFTLAERDGGVVVKVKESGFSTLPGTDDFRMEQYKGNVEGWGIMLGLLKRDAEA
jgi:uncharacterized protein YndB with AHSA1/START domain